MYTNFALQKESRNNVTAITDQKLRRLASSIRLTPEQEARFLKLKPILLRLREAIKEMYGTDVMEGLFGNLVPPVVLYPPVRPDKYSRAHPATFDEREVTDHIELLSNPGELVLDIMAGSGTSLIASYKKGRIGAGIELMEQWVELTKKRISEITGSEYRYGKYNLFLKQGDCREVMPKMIPKIADLILFSPPYFDILRNPTGGRAEYRRRLGLPVNYGNSPKDLGNIHDYREFMQQMGIIYSQCFRVLKKGKFMVVIVADIFSRRQFVPYHMDTTDVAQDAGFTLKGIQVVMDHWKRKYVYGPPKGFFTNFHHHYALIFQKP